MKIKTRLSLYFTLISSGALLLVLVAVYVAVFSFFTQDFYNRLQERTHLASQFYLKADELTSDSLIRVQQKYLERLPDEVMKIYDDYNLSAFNTESNIYWTKDIIEQVRRDGYIEYEEGPRKVFGKYYHDNQGNYVILASAVDANLRHRTIVLAKITTVLFFIFGIGLFFAGRIFAQKALSPVDNLVKQISNIQASNLHLRVDEVNTKDEIAELVNNFNRLLEHLQNAFELQQTFVANASHELRTPLTSIMGEVDVALNKKRNMAEYERVLHSIANDGARLQETITSLMELAQVDLNYTRAALTPIRVDELLWELEEYWANKKGPGQLQIKLNNLPEDESLLTMPAHKSMLFIALNNIIDNAFKYSAGQPVVLGFEANTNAIRIGITDKGQGISKEDIEKIFRPFFRVNKDRSISGSGIGLYIAHKIIELFKGSIKVASKPGKGSTFTVEFLTHNSQNQF
ncbi:HAMP domain-containing sensor histidine kinase [Mucilaginibacter pedocola]|uniref:histidine kinase n=1 Tax=Mucilaginibacter pedocola TaxID=1792845 RepID=A0A1S9P7X0_9SPHI|nr:HAMP domain-containing sensor histidine kinase [Mucilaginibacter pedocola]OOQ57044.1 hypothetical protein BC343_16035 [Mucilaginibacter pedocola]